MNTDWPNSDLFFDRRIDLTFLLVDIGFMPSIRLNQEEHLKGSATLKQITHADMRILLNRILLHSTAQLMSAERVKLRRKIV